MERVHFRQLLIELHKKSGMDAFLEWPFVFDAYEKGAILVDEKGQFWLADKRSNWLPIHLNLSMIENLRFSRAFDEPCIDGDAMDMEDVTESSIHINFASGENIVLWNRHESYEVVVHLRLLQTDENAENLENLKRICESGRMQIAFFTAS